MSLSSRLNDSPAVSLSADGGHGSHCYDADGTLVCGFPELHATGPCNNRLGKFDLECDRSIGHDGMHMDSGADLPKTIYWK
jgi:hypothetical protein